MTYLRPWLATVSALVIACAAALPSVAAASGATGPVILAQYDAQLPLFNAASWNVIEDGGWNAVWTFDSGRRTMTGVWINRDNGQSVTVSRMRVQQRGQQIVISRPGLGNYVGTIANGGDSISGTLSWSSGHFSASVAAPPEASIGRLPLFSASGWNVSEDGGWNGVWTFDRGHRTMSAVWTNRQNGQRTRAYGMFVRQEGQQIIIARPGLGNYVGTISTDGTGLEGTMSWSSGRFRAQIR
jgi:hypothetical protein